MHLFKALLLFILQAFIEAGNETSGDSECIFTDIKSQLSIASRIIETAKEKIPKGNTDSEAENKTSTSYECLFTEIKSHLRIASQIIETAKQEIPNDLKELCKDINSNECKNVTEVKPLDCSDIYLSGERRDGLYSVWPQSEKFEGPLRVFCDMESDGGGWTVIQRRGDYGSSRDYFYRDWNSYKMGFGHMMEDFWIGNDNLFALTNQRLYQLRINLTDWEGDSAYAIYDEFRTSDELQNYTLHFKDYQGTAGNDLNIHNGQKFTTIDRDNDLWSTGNCAVEAKGAWWFNNCRDSCLNGFYHTGANITRYDGVMWRSFKGFYYSYKVSIMKIRPADFADTSNRVY